MSDHFDGKRFFNEGVEEVTMIDLLRWQTSRDHGYWPKSVMDKKTPKPVEHVGQGELVVTWVGHATLLVQLEGKNVLTDPIWSDTVGPIAGMGPRRVREPGIAFEDLPRIDAVVISHNHYDHLDLPTLQRLSAAFAPRVYVGLGNKTFLEAAGVKNVTELDWWQKDDAAGLTITSVPVQHFSRRGLTDGARSLWAGYVITAGKSSVYFAGDTATGPHFAEVGERLGPMRAALLPIGAYLPRWFMQRMHASPSEAIVAATALKAETSIAMHFDTFDLADEAYEQAPRELLNGLRQMRDAPRFLVPTPGVAISVQ